MHRQIQPKHHQLTRTVQKRERETNEAFLAENASFEGSNTQGMSDVFLITSSGCYRYN